MRQLSPQSADRFQQILSKKIGKQLTPTELEQAYTNLMGFAFALIELTLPENSAKPEINTKPKTRPGYDKPLAFTKYSGVYC